MGTSSVTAPFPRDIGVIDPTNDDNLCGVCKNSVRRAIVVNNIEASDNRFGRLKGCPHFCIACDSWFHFDCVPETCIRDSKLDCPNCGRGVLLKTPDLYCKACGASTRIASSKTWPETVCSKCGKANSLAILTDRLFGWELAWTFFLAVISFAAFIVSLVEGASPLLRDIAIGFAAMFSGPWILLIIATVVKGMMPTSIDLGPVGNFTAGIAGDVVLNIAREFKNRPFWYRFLRVYLWVLANGVLALFVIAAGIAVIYFVTELAKH